MRSSHSTSTAEFILYCLVMLAIIITTFFWAHTAWLEHYA